MALLTFFRAAAPVLQDLAATLVFIVLANLTGSPTVATGIALGVGAAQLAFDLIRRKPVPALQWASWGLVLVFGGAGLLTHDTRFMMFKPSVIYAVVGGSMLQKGWMRRYMPDRALAYLSDGQIVAWGYVWAGLLLATGALNAGFALFSDFKTWSRFVLIFPVASKVGLFLVQYAVIRRTVRRRILAERAGGPPSVVQGSG